MFKRTAIPALLSISLAGAKTHSFDISRLAQAGNIRLDRGTGSNCRRQSLDADYLPPELAQIVIDGLDADVHRGRGLILVRTFECEVLRCNAFASRSGLTAEPE